jgi:hypothetical protein
MVRFWDLIESYPLLGADNEGDLLTLGTFCNPVAGAGRRTVRVEQCKNAKIFGKRKAERESQQ